MSHDAYGLWLPASLDVWAFRDPKNVSSLDFRVMVWRRPMGEGRSPELRLKIPGSSNNRGLSNWNRVLGVSSTRIKIRNLQDPILSITDLRCCAVTCLSRIPRFKKLTARSLGSQSLDTQKASSRDSSMKYSPLVWMKSMSKSGIKIWLEV